jgi:hypothetical protein
MLGLQQFIDPGAEYVIAADNLEQKEQEGDSGAGDDEHEIRANLSASLAETPIDFEEVRRALSRAHQAGLDWRQCYEVAVQRELAVRPYRAPSLPPATRVAPSGSAA